jgi:bifunctional non-homologous end joining protein LigD
LEFHIPHHRVARHPDGRNLSLDFLDSDEQIDHSILNYPDHLTFDLDPYVYSGLEKDGEEPEFNEAGFEKGKEVAFWLKEILDALGLKSYVKLSGKTGLHIFAPIIRNLNFDEVRAICETFSRTILMAHPNDITIEWSTAKRTGKIFMDYNMNVRGKTLNAPFSPRALPGAMVSMPVTWDELPSANPLQYRMWNIWDRMLTTGDVWTNLLDNKVDLHAMMGG